MIQKTAKLFYLDFSEIMEKHKTNISCQLIIERK